MYNYPCFRQSQNAVGPMQPPGMSPMQPIGTTLPTGMPAGQFMSPMPAPIMDMQGLQSAGIEPETLKDTNFLPGFLKTQIGKTMRVQFLIGTTGPLIDRIGTLLGVGANYILLRPQETDDILTCDLYAIKFVDIFQ